MLLASYMYMLYTTLIHAIAAARLAVRVMLVDAHFTGPMATGTLWCMRFTKRFLR